MSIPRYISPKSRTSYVYVLFRPWNGSPCYVGKGKGSRWLWHGIMAENHPNRHLRNIFKKSGGELPIVRIRTNLTNRQAIEIEIALIKAIGREKNGGPLVNATDGGEGNIGFVQSKEQRENSRKNMERCLSDPIIRAKFEAGWTRAGKDPVVKQKRSQANKASAKAKAQRDALRKDPIVLAKRSQQMKKRWKDPKYREKVLTALHSPQALENHKKAMNDPALKIQIASKTRGRKDSPETVERKRQAALKRKPPTEETRAKLSYASSHQSEEAKKKHGIKSKQNWEKPEYRAKIKLAKTGKVKVTDGIICKMVDPADIPTGWVLCKKPKR